MVAAAQSWCLLQRGCSPLHRPLAPARYLQPLKSGIRATRARRELVSSPLCCMFSVLGAVLCAAVSLCLGLFRNRLAGLSSLTRRCCQPPIMLSCPFVHRHCSALPPAHLPLHPCLSPLPSFCTPACRSCWGERRRPCSAACGRPTPATCRLSNSVLSSRCVARWCCG